MTNATATTNRREIPFWQVLIVAIFFGLFYAYNLWQAIGNLVGINVVAEGLGYAITATGWVVLIAGILLPPLVFALCLWLGRRRGLFALILILFTGLCAVASLWISMLSVFTLGNLIN